MITLKNVTLNNGKNKTFLKLCESIRFENNTINLIIGRSGIGKTSLIDFMASPFTDDPIKNGDIIISPEIAVATKGKKSINQFSVINSASQAMGPYAQFVKSSIAYIPQKTDSFHPAIPVRKQMYRYYKAALEAILSKKIKADREDFLTRLFEELDPKVALPKNKGAYKRELFNHLLEKLSPWAGWDKIVVDTENPEALMVFDKKEYADDCGGEPVTIVDTQKGSDKGVKVYESEFSSGQLQRIFILLGLIKVYLAETPILLCDEFLVNFTYCEAAEVLKKTIDFFFNTIKKKHKTAVFILHDLSFDFLGDSTDSRIKVFALEQDNAYKRDAKRDADHVHRILKHETGIYGFFHDEPETHGRIFRDFLESYSRGIAMPVKKGLRLKNNDDVIMNAKVGPSKYPGLYGEIAFALKQGCFYVLTGFSGVGKTTFCDELLSRCANKKSFRYLTSHMLSAISMESRITIRQDLSLVYRYYNGIEKLDDCWGKIEKLFGDLQLDLGSYIDKGIYDLSGGELQRYWFARLLLDHNLAEGESQFIMLDESIASLDCISKNIIIIMLIENVLVQRGMTVFLVSHDLRDISVINKTLESMPGGTAVFEHYEMFGGKIHKVITPFAEYCKNMVARNYNSYQFAEGEKKYRLNKVTNKAGMDTEEK